MKTLSIKGDIRKTPGKKSSRILRRNNQVPCILYGGKEETYFSTEERSFKKLVYSPDAYSVKLSIGDKELNAVMQEVQFHPVTDKILHVDFLELHENKPTAIHIPVVLKGNSIGVLDGGQLIQKMRKLKVKALPSKLPDYIEIDIEDIQIGGSVKVGDLSVEGVEMLDGDNVVILRVKVPRSLKALEEEIEALAGDTPEVEGEAVEGAEGETAEGEGAEGEGAEGTEAEGKPEEGNKGSDETPKASGEGS